MTKINKKTLIREYFQDGSCLYLRVHNGRWERNDYTCDGELMFVPLDAPY